MVHGTDDAALKVQTSAIGRITMAGTITEFAKGLPATTGPRSIVAGPDGNLWFMGYSPGTYGRITTSGTISVYNKGLAGGALGYGITVGPDRNLWFTELGANRVGKIVP